MPKKKSSSLKPTHHESREPSLLACTMHIAEEIPFIKIMVPQYLSIMSPLISHGCFYLLRHYIPFTRADFLSLRSWKQTAESPNGSSVHSKVM